MSYVATLRKRGEHAEARRLVSEAVVRHRGNLLAASHDLGLGWQGVTNFVRWYDLWGVVDDARARAGAPPPWLVRTLSVIEGGVMGAIEELYKAAAGMSVDEIAAEIESSIHAGTADSQALAEAIAVGAEAMAAPEG